VTRKRRRLAFLVLGLAVLGFAAALVLSAFDENLRFFYSPSELAEATIPQGRIVRIGGLVEEGSLRRSGQDARFRVTDLARTVEVAYRGQLPDLFREGQGVICEGTLGEDGTFRAAEVLAKHDETYMPREVADALKKSGRWKEGEKEGQSLPRTAP
jgi:cytochrome c-type biogenesis protein CcmE